MSNRIAVVDYGSGNIRSVVKVIQHLGYEAWIASKGSELAGATHLILPGVGAFDPAINALNARPGLRVALESLVLSQKKLVLGLCLGMQLLVNTSEEGDSHGLGFVEGHCKLFPKSDNFKVPHMGWNRAVAEREHPLLGKNLREWRFYFVHSYFVEVANPDHVLLTTDHIVRFHSAFASGNVFGVQFHPEKSHRFGLELIGNFCALNPEA